MQPIVDAKISRQSPQLEKPRQKNDERELGHFRRLKTEWSHAKPAMRLMRAVKEKHADEQHERQSQPGEYNSRLAQLAIVHIHQPEHSGDTQRHVNQLPQQENIAR